MADINFVFFLSLSIIGIGFLVKKLNIITEKDGKGIAKLILNVTLPALIFNVISQIELNPDYVFLFIISIGFSLGILAFGMLVFRDKPNPIKGIALMTIIGYNIGLFAYPLIEGIYGIQGLQYVALFDFGNAFIIFGLGYSIAAIYSPKKEEKEHSIDHHYILKKLLTSVPLISYVMAVVLNLMNVQFPIFVVDLIGIISRANMALTLLLLGIYLNFKFEMSEWEIVLKVLVIRYVFGITVGLILFFTLPFNILYRTILLIALILPVGMAVVPFSVEYKYNEKLTGIIVNLSIIFSFILMWIFTLLIGV